MEISLTGNIYKNSTIKKLFQQHLQNHTAHLDTIPSAQPPLPIHSVLTSLSSQLDSSQFIPSSQPVLKNSRTSHGSRNGSRGGSRTGRGGRGGRGAKVGSALNFN